MKPSGNSRIYLDNAATSFPKPDCVYDAVEQYMRNNGSPFGRGSHATGDAATQLVVQCRHRLALILGAASPSEIAFTFNCTDGLNLLLRGCLSAGDRVVTSTLEHNSVLRPLTQLQDELQLEIVNVGFDVNSGLVDESEMIRQLSSKRTKLMVLNHASNVTGIVQPVKRLCQAAHEKKALFLLDAAQTVGHLPFSVADLQIDMLASAGHKGLLGPLGTGVVYIRSGLESQLKPVRCGGTGTQSESLQQPTTMPAMLESGNHNMPGLVGLAAASEWLLQHDIAAMHRQIAAHTKRLKSKLTSIAGVTVHVADSVAENVGIVSFVIAGMDSREAAVILDQSFQIQCRAGLHCAPLVHEALKTSSSGGSIRLSPGVFTTDNDIETAIDAIEQLTAAVA
ncbi:MAG: aminotransferase class V-fold PLP-dependent enzyme [Fuerstiella sp.]